MPVFVVSPAADGSVVEEGAGVSVACGDCGGGASAAEGDGVARCVPILVTVVTELPVFVVSPAADGSVVEEGAGVLEACGDCGGGASVGEGDGVAWCIGIGICSVAKLTRVVVSPACDLTVVEECASVEKSGGDCGGGASVGEGDGVAWCVPSLVTVVAELTVLVVSPASNRAGIR